MCKVTLDLRAWAGLGSPLEQWSWEQHAVLGGAIQLVGGGVGGRGADLTTLPARTQVSIVQGKPHISWRIRCLTPWLPGTELKQ